MISCYENCYDLPYQEWQTANCIFVSCSCGHCYRVISILHTKTSLGLRGQGTELFGQNHSRYGDYKLPHYEINPDFLHHVCNTVINIMNWTVTFTTGSSATLQPWIKMDSCWVPTQCPWDKIQCFILQTTGSRYDSNSTEELISGRVFWIQIAVLRWTTRWVVSFML
jgi:hypothetical protein